MAQYSDKTPPHDDELERATLGSLLQDADALDAALQQHLQADDFYSRANQRVYDAILSLVSKKGKRADIQTVVQELKQLGKLDEAGGASYVSSLTTVIPSSANIDYYAESVRNYSLKRSLLKVASEIGAKAYDESRDARELLEEIQQLIFELSDNRQAWTFKKIGELLKETIQKIDKVMKEHKTITGTSTGFDVLDQMTSGFQPSDFVVIGARPSVGKTALALNIASTIAFEHRKPTAFFSLEMSDVALTQRLISSEAEVPGSSLRSGFISTADYNKIVAVMGKMYEAPFYIVDMPNMRLLDLRAQARKLCTMEKIEVIFIDYLGLIGHENNSLPRYEQISEISRSLKSLARELNIPVIVLCQLNREAQWEVPNLSNLRDSGSIEQDADLVLFLHREQDKKNKKQTDDNKVEKPVLDVVPTSLIIAKQRNGPVGTIKLALHTKFAKFKPASSNA